MKLPYERSTAFDDLGILYGIFLWMKLPTQLIIVSVFLFVCVVARTYHIVI